VLLLYLLALLSEWCTQLSYYLSELLCYEQIHHMIKGETASDFVDDYCPAFKVTLGRASKAPPLRISLCCGGSRESGLPSEHA